MEDQHILKEWRDRSFVLATMHQKESIIAPLFERELGVSIVVPKGFDTDQFGTFTREISRAGNQLEAARTKALAALAHTGADVALASEGSFGEHPEVPFLSSNLELVVLLDQKYGLEIVGQYRTSDVIARGATVTSSEEAVRIAESWGFPGQGVIVRMSERSNRQMYKDIETREALKEVCDRLLSRWFTTSVFIETDMRAHRCPERMGSIREATIDLIRNCKQTCPVCGAPGFRIVDVVRGVPCLGCGLPTDQVATCVHQCQLCKHEERRPVDNGWGVDPGLCPRCNP